MRSSRVTLETSYDDWCVAQLAKALNNETDYADFMKRARNYRNVFDDRIGFMAPKSADGKWVEGFDPKLGGGDGGRDYFAEMNAWTYSFSVQHDIGGLIDLMGGPSKFLSRLDALFVEQYGGTKRRFLNQFPDMTGLIGQYAQGDEASFHISYLYNHAGQPWKTQQRVKQIMRIWYNASPLGICGDEDGGAESSWYVLSAMGFYPTTPGKPEYDIGSPVFDEVAIRLENGRTFRIVARNNSRRNKFIQSAILNGRTLGHPWFAHQELANGGTLTLQMGAEPNFQWGATTNDAGTLN